MHTTVVQGSCAYSMHNSTPRTSLVSTCTTRKCVYLVVWIALIRRVLCVEGDIFIVEHK